LHGYLAESLLVCVPMQMKRLHGYIGAIQAPLEQAPEILDSTGKVAIVRP
jgi:hypothetical protein